METTDPSSTTGLVFDLQRFSIHDGPGIRTTVFLKGCPLRCLWCHNPESQDFLPAIAFDAARCIHCGRCVAACPEGCHGEVENGTHRFDRTRCTLCGRCVEACCTGALELTGRTMSVGAVLAEVLRDKPFYESSGGGLTLSGGEPMAQFPFTAALLAAARREGLHTCVETSGCGPFSNFAAILPSVDLFLFDLKETDPASHLRCTGVPLEGILANLRELDSAGAAFFLRCPVIPGINDRDAHFQAIARIAGTLRGLSGIDLLAYHPMGTGKHARFGTESTFVAETPSSATVDQWIVRMAELAPGIPVRRG